ncbi:MAG TPA: pseudouridine synthase [Candidatus Eremiobacteraceae bacterium]|nr:pseudouridine synthase [Candidatus Eremiobacteraceae bacterium]
MARALSKLGYCSRSRAAELIRAGRVNLNGEIRRDPETPVSSIHSQIAVDGKLVQARKKIYLMLNKPRGVVTTASDEKDRDTVYGILDNHANSRMIPKWVAPVGRLDKASEGLLLLTNDSEWAARIAAPETHLDKTYHVQVGTIADEQFIQALRRGVKTKDGEVLRAKEARTLRAGQKNCWLEIVLDEGKNRHVRRMTEALGVEVLRLVRVAIGPLQLGDLAKAQFRTLTTDEKRMLDRALRGKGA